MPIQTVIKLKSKIFVLTDLITKYLKEDNIENINNIIDERFEIIKELTILAEKDVALQEFLRELQRKDGEIKEIILKYQSEIKKTVTNLQSLNQYLKI
jgi:ribosomal 50S subunit-associated protein YjgA (DUF615 family)